MSWKKNGYTKSENQNLQYIVKPQRKMCYIRNWKRDCALTLTLGKLFIVQKKKTCNLKLCSTLSSCIYFQHERRTYKWGLYIFFSIEASILMHFCCSEELNLFLYLVLCGVVCFYTDRTKVTTDANNHNHSPFTKKSEPKRKKKS